MKTLSVQSVGADPNLMAFDDGRHLLYVATHSGILSVFTDAGRTVNKVLEACVATNAHSIFVDQETYRIYLPLESIPSDTCAVPPRPTNSPTATSTTSPSIVGKPVLRIMTFNLPGASS